MNGSFTGAATYYDAFPEGRETKPRIFVEFRPQDVDTTALALLDTGGHYCILSADVRELVEDRLTDFLGHEKLRTAYGTIEGELYILPIQLLAAEGEHLSLEVVAFIAPEWPASNFLGYSGALDRLRFAIDPSINRFSFSSLT